MLVIGIDTKARSFHWVADHAMPEGYGLKHQGTYGWTERPESEIVDVARASLYWDSDALFSALYAETEADPVDVHVFCEEPLALQNGKTTRILCLAAGAVWSGFVASQINATWYWVDPATWKKATLGKGAPPKGQKHKEWIEELTTPMVRHTSNYRLPDFQAHPDLFDAFQLMRYGKQVLEQAGYSAVLTGGSHE